MDTSQQPTTIVEVQPGGDQQVSLWGNIKQGLSVPLPWFIAIVGGLIFNAGFTYAQFQGVQSTTEVTASTAKRIEQQMIHLQDSDDSVKEIVKDHEDRLRTLEHKKSR